MNVDVLIRNFSEKTRHRLRMVNYTILIGFLLYLTFVLVLLVPRQRPDALLMAAGGAIGLVTVVNDVLHHNQLIHSMELLPVGLFAFIVLQSFILSQRYAAYQRLANRDSLTLHAIDASGLEFDALRIPHS